MKRRGFLAGAAALATSGCLGRAVGDGATTTDGTTTSQPPATDGGACPDVRREVAATVCSGQDGGYGATIAQSAQTVPADGELVVTLTNEGAESVGFNPYAWAVHERTEKGWKRVGPDVFIEPWTVLSRGDSQEWHLALGESETSEDGTTDRENTVAAGPLDLTAGDHAFSVVAQVDGERVAYVAPFTVE